MATRASQDSSGKRGKAALLGTGLGLVMGPKGQVGVAQLSDYFGMSRDQLAKTAGLPATALSKSDRANAPKTQSRLKEMLEILKRVDDWAGGKDFAMAWYRAEPIPALDGRTAEALVKDGRAADVRDYLDHLALGGYA